MTQPNEHHFESLWLEAANTLEAVRPGPAEESARLRLWRQQEWHNWFRWRVCRKGWDWSKPGVILLLAAGFGWLVNYGLQTGRWYNTAGGIVLWFTVVNLSFFIYFGLTLPGPPLPLPAPLHAGRKVRAEMGLYPPGYERRKLARVWLRIHAPEGAAHRFEITYGKLPEDLAHLLIKQTRSRMHGGDAPLTRVVVETLHVDRVQIDRGTSPLAILGWQWKENEKAKFDRARI